MRISKSLHILFIILIILFSCGKRNDYSRSSEIGSGWKFYGPQNPADWNPEPAAENISFIKEEIVRKGWYRKTFMLENQDTSKSLYLVFRGLFWKPNLFINGHTVKDSNEKENIQIYKISGVFNSGENTIDIQIDSTLTGLSCTQPSASIIIANPVHIIPGGLNLKATNTDSTGIKLEISVMLQNDTRKDADVKVISHIYHPSQGRLAVINSDGIEFFDNVTVTQKTEFKNYDPMKMVKYECVTDILTGENTILDTYVKEFTIRSIEKLKVVFI